jgi:transposase
VLKEDQAQVEATMTTEEPPSQAVQAFTRRKPAREPLPEHLSRERVVHPAPSACPCGGGSLHKLGEDVTETLELVPRQWKVIQHVREKFFCCSCEKITQPPAPSHPIARGRAGPGLLAHVLFGKYGPHPPLTRQAATYAREGVPLEVSTLADWVGTSATLMPLVESIRAHVFAAERLHADETTVLVLAAGKTRTGRLWTYVRDDRPFAGADPPAAAYFYRRSDAGGCLCRWRSVRQERSRARVEAMESWLREQYDRLSPNSQVVKAIAYSVNRWDGLAHFLDDGRLCMTNNAAERALRGIAVGRHNLTFADAGSRRAAVIYTLIETTKLNDIDPQAWLADMLARLHDHQAAQIAQSEQTSAINCLRGPGRRRTSLSLCGSHICDRYCSDHGPQLDLNLRCSGVLRRSLS